MFSPVQFDSQMGGLGSSVGVSSTCEFRREMIFGNLKFIQTPKLQTMLLIPFVHHFTREIRLNTDSWYLGSWHV